MATISPEEKSNSWESVLAPRALLLGIACSFAGCCLAGLVVSHRNLFVQFERFVPHIAPGSLFYPTASEVRALAREKLNPEKVAVIVGGNSIALGVGQRPEYLWTKKLQEELGENYRVINLAMRGAYPAEFATVAADFLSRDYPKLIYMTVVGCTTVPDIPDGNPPYRYFFWDAYYRNLLLHDAERESNLRKVCQLRKHDADFAELQLQMRLDRHVHSRDLWNTLAYEHCSTVWCPLIGPLWWQPRKVYGDPEPGGLIPFENRYCAALDAHDMKIVKDFARIGAPLYEGSGAAVPKGLRAIFPAPYRRRTLLLLCHDSPYFVERLTLAEQSRYRGTFAAAVPCLEREGFAALEVGQEYSTEDYYDRCHLSEAGGSRLAGAVTVKVRQMARDLGFVREEIP